MIELDELQNDALSEMLNIGIGRAASALSQMVGDTIDLSVPHVDFQTRKDVASFMNSQSPQGVVAVRESFHGPFAGEVMLLFPEQRSLELVRALLNDSIPLDMLTEMEEEALVEVGNVILNSCLGTLADILKYRIESAIPRFVKGNPVEFFVNDSVKHETDLVMFMRVNFALSARKIDGYVAFLMDLQSAEALKDAVVNFMGQTY